MGDVPNSGGLFFGGADRGRSQGGCPDGVQAKRETTQSRTRISSETVHAKSLRVEERKMGEQNRTHEGLPRRVLGAVQIPRKGQRLGRRTIQGTLWDPPETQSFRNSVRELADHNLGARYRAFCKL